MRRLLVPVSLIVICVSGCDTPTRVPVATIEIDPAAATVRVGQSVPLRAILRDEGGRELRNRQVTWVSESSALAYVTSSEGAQTTAVAVRPGRAHISAFSERSQGDVYITIQDTTTYRAVDSIFLSPSAISTQPNTTVQVSATLWDASRNVLSGRTVQWTVSDTSIARVSPSSGSVVNVTTRRAGQARVYASSEGKQASLSVTVSSGFSASIADTLLNPGATLTIRGSGLRSATVQIGGSAAAASVDTDSLVQVTVPNGPFEPCLGFGQRLAVRVAGATDTVRADIRAAPQPLVVRLSPGAYTLTTPAVGRGCAVELADAGTYLAMPFRLDKRDGSGAHIDSLSARLTIRPPGGSLPLKEIRLPRHVPRAKDRGVPDVVRRSDGPFLRVSPNPSLAAASCELPSQVGQTIVLFTNRRSDGTLPLGESYSGKTEEWRLQAISVRLAVFVDTPTVRAIQEEPELAVRIRELAVAFDTSMAPFLDVHTQGLPDRDGNGRVLAFLTAAGGPFGGYTEVTQYPRADCGTAGVPGEAFYVNIQTRLRGSALSAAFSVLVHEAAHIADLGWSTSRLSNPTWAIEGFATLNEVLWATRATSNPLLANLSEAPLVRAGSGATGVECWIPHHSGIAGINAAGTLRFVYLSGCQQIAYILSHYQQRGNTSTAAATRRWGEMGVHHSFPSFWNSVMGANGDASSIWAEYLMSWFADDYVSATIATLQEPMWDLRRLYSTGPFPTPFPLPDARISVDGGFVDLRLSVPDVRHVEIEAMVGTRLLYGTIEAQGLPTSSTNLALLRVR